MVGTVVALSFDSVLVVLEAVDFSAFAFAFAGKAVDAPVAHKAEHSVRMDIVEVADIQTALEELLVGFAYSIEMAVLQHCSRYRLERPSIYHLCSSTKFQNHVFSVLGNLSNSVQSCHNYGMHLAVDCLGLSRLVL